jgi:hypothetical protein
VEILIDLPIHPINESLLSNCLETAADEEMMDNVKLQT